MDGNFVTRPEESGYWDSEARQTFRGGKLHDNTWKREKIVHRLLKDSWIDETVLEIGIGSGVAASVLSLLGLNPRRYIATDVSEVFVSHAKEVLELKAIQADLLHLPRCEGGFTRVIALDSLEHVRPEDRMTGFKDLGGILAPHARIYINMPLSETRHDLKFDHPFGLEDLALLEINAGVRLESYERYSVQVPKLDKPIEYGFAVLDR